MFTLNPDEIELLIEASTKIQVRLTYYGGLDRAETNCPWCEAAINLD